MTKSQRRWACAFLGLALVNFNAIAGNAAPYHAPIATVENGFLGIHIVDQVYWGEGASAILADLGGLNSQNDTMLCGGQSGVACDFKALGARSMQANIILPKCADAVEENCIEGLSVYDAAGLPKPAEFIREVGGSTTAPDPSVRLTRGGTVSLWNATDKKNAAGTTTYSVIAQLKLDRRSASQPFQVSNINITVMPYVEQVTQFGRPITWTETRRADNTRQIGTVGGTPDCAWVDTNRCGFVEDFAGDTRVKLDLRLTKSIGGWFKGRMQKPEISILNFSPTANLVSLDGEYSRVPQFFTLLDRENGDPKLRALVGLDRGQHPQGPLGGGVTSTTSDQVDAFTWIEQFRDLAKDTASGVSTVWSAGTIQGGQGSCLGDTSKLLGMVSTNSMAYEGKSPSFDGSTLSYKVAGMHYLPKGAEAVTGTYDLVMRSETARCLYGFTKAPISATISVTATDGDAKVATTLVSERDGWLKLSAYGFTFSENRITAKITQVGVAKNSTITCVNTKNKKLTKKVTAVSPKCPAGYKKK